jgi:hypothetical protein
VNAYFSGDITLKTEAGDVELSISDIRYNNASTENQPGSLTLVNLPPLAVDDNAITDEDIAVTIDVLANDSDPEGDTLVITTYDAASAQGGSIDCSSGQCIYTPPANFYGSDSFSYFANDGLQNSSVPATVSITVNPINDAGPVAVDDAYSVNEDTLLSVDASSGVLANDTDVDNDPLTAILVAESGPAHGTLTFNSDGSFTYQPEPDFNGPDTFSYRANDGMLDSDTPAIVTLMVNPVNDPPLAVDDSATTGSNQSVVIDVLGNDTDPDGDTLVIDSVTQGANGAVANNGTDVTYTPNPDFTGPDAFTYTISDGNGGFDSATVNVTVTLSNQPPDCSAATATPVTIWPPDKTLYPVTVLNVSDTDGDPINITIDSIFQDEAVGKGKNSPDGQGVGSSTAEVRAERDGNGDGRVYHIGFTASDGLGGLCSGSVRAGIVPHDQGGDLDAVDGGPLYDSTVSD